MKTIIYILFISLFSLSVSAQVQGIVTDSQGEPLIGVNVFWLETTDGTTTDANGKFSIFQNLQANHFRLVFSSVMFNNDTITVSNPNEPIRVTLNEAIQLQEVSIVHRRMGVIRPRTAVIQTEMITTHELSRAACCNLSEAFETNPSVDVEMSDAATGAKQIRLLGLSGTYVQMLTENIPNLRGISSAYGLGFIPGPWIEGIQISKGAGSVINGYEAVTGQINVELKNPNTNERAFANLFLSDAGRVEANANASARINDKLSTGVLLHFSDEFRDNHQKGVDFLDLPKIRQYNAVNRWFYTDGDFTSQVFLRGLHENRIGGQIKGDYKIGVETKRYEFFTKNGYVFDHERNTSIGFILSGSHHEQNAHYGLNLYDGKQGNIYANLIFHTDFTENHKLSAGASFNMDNFNENLTIPSENFEPMLRREYVPGMFAEYTFELRDKLTALVGLRGDYNSHFDRFFVTPRAHLRYCVSEHIHVRASVGKGYRSPNIWAENNFLLASSRKMIVADNLKMEEAWNYGFSTHFFIPIFGRELALMGEWFYTDFIQQTVIDMDAATNEIRFYNLNNGKSYASNLQFEANMEIARGLTATLAHRIMDVKTTINGELREKPLTNRYRSMFTASYQTPQNKWQFDYTAVLSGGGRLPDPNPEQPLWDERFKPFWTMNAQITKNFRTWSVYLGSENLTGFVQKNPIIGVDNPFGNDFDAMMIWGPTHGRKFYIGFNWSLNRE
jgi:outer membrane cobalamin receptor